MPLADAHWLGNSPFSWLAAGAISSLVWLAVAGARWLAQRRLTALATQSATAVDDSILDEVRRTRLWLVVLPALYLGARVLELPAAAERGLITGAFLCLVLQIGLWGNGLLEFWLGRSKARALESDAGSATSLAALGFVGKLLLWSVLLLMALDNLGVNVTALVAGLGVGGIAVALAVQNILGDLFASLSIVIDKPFVLGDFIIVDDYMGTVENVGLKTTRIRSLSGEQLVFSNSDLLNSRVRNYKRMHERRVLFGFGVLYQTPPDLLEWIPTAVRTIVEELPDTRFDRAHFKGFGDSAYAFEVVYWMLDPDYTRYMDTQQAINLALVRAFADAGVEFAYPTRTVYMHHEQTP